MVNPPLSRRAGLALLIAISRGASLLAQCPQPGTWSTSLLASSPVGFVRTMATWDPDGPGPLGPHLVGAGLCVGGGAATSPNISLYDPIQRQWSSLGAGLDGTVLALAVSPAGELFCGGEFTAAGGLPVARVARWTGSSWVEVAGGVDGTVRALGFAPGGTLYAAGDFQQAGGVLARCFAAYDGVAWQGVGGGVQGTTVIGGASLPPRITAMAVLPNGEVAVGGWFPFAGTASVSGFAIWNGTSWGSGGFVAPPAFTTTLAAAPGGDLLLERAGAVWRRSAGQWSSFGSLGFGQRAQALLARSNGALLALVGSEGLVFGALHEWNGTAWLPAAGPDPVLAHTLHELPGGALVVAGLPAQGAVDSVQVLAGGAWVSPADGLDGRITQLETTRADELVAAGSFTQLGGVPLSGLAVLRGGVWSQLGGGVNGPVAVLRRAANGELWVGGSFTAVGGVPAAGLARWTGSQWLVLPAAPVAQVSALRELANGDLLVYDGDPVHGGLVRWTGSQWLSMAPPTVVDAIVDLVELPNGTVLGLTDEISFALAWNGSSWQPLVSGLPAVFGRRSRYCLTRAGELLAVGHFTSWSTWQSVGAVRWTGSNWVPLPGLAEFADDARELPDGDIVIAGQALFGAPPTSLLWRWNGTTSQPLSTGRGSAECLAVADDGVIWVGGLLGEVGGQPAGGLASYQTGCPATVQAAGAGCVGAGGPVELVVLARAWLGATYRTKTTGLPAVALVVQALGVQALGVPLASLLAEGLPGCVLHVVPDVLEAAVAANGSSTAAFAIPVLPALLGQSFRQQSLGIELDALGGLAAVSASNAVAATLGAW